MYCPPQKKLRQTELHFGNGSTSCSPARNKGKLFYCCRFYARMVFAAVVVVVDGTCIAPLANRSSEALKKRQ